MSNLAPHEPLLDREGFFLHRLTMFDIGVVPTIHIADITYIGTAERRLYLGCARDVFTCELVGYAMGRRMTQDVAPQARRCVERNTRQTPGLVHNSIRALSTFRRRRSLRKLAKQRWLPASGLRQLVA